MIGGGPLGIVPLGGAFAPGGEPAANATLATLALEAFIEPSDPLEAAFNGDFSRTAFAVELKPFFVGDDA